MVGQVHVHGQRDIWCAHDDARHEDAERDDGARFGLEDGFHFLGAEKSGRLRARDDG